MRELSFPKRFCFILPVFFLWLGLSVSAQEVGGAKPEASKIAEGVYLIDSLPCNIVALTGPEGVLLIDDGTASSARNLKKILAAIDPGPVRIVLNTHYHFDHVGANALFAEDGAVIIAQENTRRRMSAEWKIPEKWRLNYPVIPPYPEVALPKITFADRLAVHFNGQTIDIVHFPKAHSEADGAVYLRDVNVLHTGDLYLSNGFPVIDSLFGGTIDGTIRAVDGLVDLIDEQTIIVPGHGPVSNRKELRAYRKMLALGRERIAALIEKGRTLEEIVAADPMAGLYEKGESWLPSRLFILTVYADLAERDP